MLSASETFSADMLQPLWLKQAAEKVREQQQGYGRPIISFESHGYRIVVVGNKICWSNQWAVFSDFLLDHMKDVLNRQWGQREAQNPSSTHPLFNWLRKFQEYRKTHGTGDGRLRSAPPVGFTSALFQFGYLPRQ